jgi:hypothetical protein
VSGCKISRSRAAASQPWIHAGKQSSFADAHRDNGKRFVVRAGEKLTAFVKLESAIRRPKD